MAAIHPGPSCRIRRGTIANGVSLAQMMDTLGSDSFATTQRNAARGYGNTDPRRSVRQQPAVELSRQGFDWLNRPPPGCVRPPREYPQHLLRDLDWPEIPVRSD